MAFEQYLISRQQTCYKSPLTYRPLTPTPECTPDKYTTYFRKRWDALKGPNPCKKGTKTDLTASCHYTADKEHHAHRYGHPGVSFSRSDEEVCLSLEQQGWISKYKNDFPVPYSHNNVDDCCKAPCPCELGNDKVPKIDYVCKPEECKERMDDMTTHRHFFTPKPTPSRPQRRVEKWDPCGCPLDGATSYRLDFPHKKRVPNGPVPAAVTKYGMWSMDQFSEEPISEETEHLSQFPPKFDTKRGPIPPRNSLTSGSGPFARASETCYEFGPKSVPYPVVPEWVLQEPVWVSPCPPLDDCTTYKHFYVEHHIPIYPDHGDKMTSPGAIPFPTLNNMWYTCCDPKVDQRTPVEIKDNDPWPYVKPCPIRYQDNLTKDPCAPFRDETTNKADFVAKKGCARGKNYAPCAGYTPPIQEFNDDTTNRTSFRAYDQAEYKNAKFSAGNKAGKVWGPFRCEPKVDKCLPRFPAPYGHPLKPFTKQCPCGPFDDRSTYHKDFKFRSKEMVRLLEEEMCEKVPVDKGVSLYRHDFVEQKGQKAQKIPPPPGKGYRCVNPNSFLDTDTLYRRQFQDFWKMGDRSRLEGYRGKRNDPLAVKRQKEAEERVEKEPFEIVAMPEGTTVEDVVKGWEQRNNNCGGGRVVY